jgi:hypothetical protein
MKMKRDKPFDCVAFKHKAQARTYRKIKHLSAERQAAYFEKQANSGKLSQWWKQAKSASVTTETACHSRARRMA